MKKIKHNTVMNACDMDNPIITSPHLDKLSCVVDIPDANLCGLAYSTLLDALNDPEDFITKAKATSKYALAVKIHYPGHDGVLHLKSPFVFLQITSKKASKCQIRLEWNPAHLTEAGEHRLDAIFIMLVGMTFYEFLRHARFTRVDFYRTIMWRDLQDYLISVKYAKSSQCFFGSDGMLGSITFGKGGSNQILAYNKAKEMHGIDAAHASIRIEARYRINLTIDGLTKFKNPFERVVIYSIACKHPPYGVGHWRAFQDSCRLRGINNALKFQPANYRAALKKALSKQPVSWWQIQPEDWEWLLTDALENAGLLNIPNTAPPLDLEYLTGQAA